MEETRRRAMLAWVRHGVHRRGAGTRFVDDNTSAPLPATADARAIADLGRMWPRAWPEQGNREDWSATVDPLALVVVGGEDGDLGEAGQRATNRPHLSVCPHRVGG